MANQITSLAKLLKEELAPGVVDSLPKLDEFFGQFKTSYMGVERSNIGRAWQVIHTFSESLSGAIKWVAAGGEEIAATQFTHSVVPGTPRRFPGLDESVLPGYFQKTITLKQAYGNTFIPTEYLHADTLPASIGSSVADIIKGTAKTIALSEIIPFYALDSKQAMATIQNITVSTGTVTFSPKGGQVGMFQNGFHVDIYDSTGVTKRNLQDVVVDRVRYLPTSTDTGGYGLVTLKTKDGLGFNSPPIDTDIVVIKGSVSIGPTGPEQWLVNSGSPFGVNVETYTQLQSLVHSANDTWNQVLADKLFGRFMKAYGVMDSPDCIITSYGVTNAAVHSYPSLGSLQVNLGNGQTLVPNFGYDMGGVSYIYNGKRVKWMMSMNMPSNTDFTDTNSKGGRLWALKTSEGNIRRYVPPKIPHTKGASWTGDEIQFLYPQGGEGGIFMPYQDSSRPTFWTQAPFTRHVEICPKILQGIKVTELAEVL